MVHARWIASSTLALVLAAAGCVGNLSDAPGASSGPGTEPTGPDPGRVTMHRLNRAEYNSTVRDLLGTKLRPADDFPADDYGYGFDNVSDVLSISPLQLELYERAAETLAEEAMALPSAALSTHVEAESLKGSIGSATADGWNLFSNGNVPFTAKLSAAGKYTISARVWASQAGADPAQAEITAGGVSLGLFDVKATSASPQIISVDAQLAEGNKVVAVGFTNDYFDKVTMADRNLYVDWIEVKGPLGTAQDNPLRDKILICDPVKGGDACVRKVIQTFAERAWRRPLATAEVDDLLTFVALAKGDGDTVDGGITLALRAILTSPHFIFRVEQDVIPTSLVGHPLNPYELASRLSYFLWSSLPDEALLQAAKAGKLADDKELEAQVARMLADPKADALIDNFAGEWLYTRALADHLPDYKAFPDFDAALGDDMRTESRMFFSEFLHGDLGIGDMLASDFTFVNDRLAKHYGLPDAPPGADFIRVDLKTAQRGGLLTQAAWLTVTSYPARTSPVKRGKWILGQLLCSEPPPPPPGVEGLKQETMQTGSIRQRMEQHRKDPMCAGCHSSMDPLGFSLENYDGIGAYRTMDGTFPIDATGQLPDGPKFDGAQEMAKLIQTDPRYGHCVTEKLFTYALGRAPSTTDKPFLEHIEGEFGTHGSKLKELIRLIVASEPFRMRRGETEPKGGQ
jgi:hypothetical protein